MRIHHRVLVLAAICLLIIGLAAFFVSIGHVIREGRQKAALGGCEMHLSVLGVAWQQYALHHEGVAPTNLRQLVAWQKDPRFYVCRLSGSEPGDMETVDDWSDYRVIEYTDPIGTTMPRPIMYCSRQSKGHRVVLFSNGAVQSGLSEQDWNRLGLPAQTQPLDN